MGAALESVQHPEASGGRATSHSASAAQVSESGSPSIFGKPFASTSCGGGKRTLRADAPAVGVRVVAGPPASGVGAGAGFEHAHARRMSQMLR
jgi:hypothetical protein